LGIQVLRRQPAKSPKSHAAPPEIHKDVVGNLILAAEFGAIDSLKLAQKFLELRIACVALGDADRREFVRMAVEDRAVDDADW
jgi:hypothetical protein